MDPPVFQDSAISTKRGRVGALHYLPVYMGFLPTAETHPACFNNLARGAIADTCAL